MRICRLALVFCNDGAVDYSQSLYISQLGYHQTQFHPTIMWSINCFVYFSQKSVESRKVELLRFLHYFEDLIKPELFEFCKEAQVTCSMTDAWTVRYQKGDQQTIHNHKSWGFTGILYLEYDPKLHTPTCFVAPWQDPRSDTTSLAFPQNVKEGTIFISPSYTLHFVHPNQVRKHRTIISFDLLPKLPDHQAVD